ncbi:MAG: methyltransferase domain-containing protein [Myxococcaceae bacterium]
MSSDYIHGGTDSREVARLVKQAGFVAPFSLVDFVVRDTDRVLDLATGVGAMAAQLRKRYPKASLTGVDLRMSQLRSAKALHPVADYVNGNGASLPFKSGAFDRVHCSWLLEHIPTPPGPVAILKEVRRVLKPDGLCHFIEVDNATFDVKPENADVTAVMDALNQAQIRGGGDPFVGRKLEGYFQQAGFSRIEVRRAPLRGTNADPEFFQAFIDEFAEIFESLDEALGPAMEPRVQRAAKALRDLIRAPGGELRYSGYIIRASP